MKMELDFEAIVGWIHPSSESGAGNWALIGR